MDFVPAYGEFCTQYNHPAPGLVCEPPEETQVQQHFKESCDVNKILDRIQRGADPSILNQRKGFYADLSDLGVSDMASALDKVSLLDEAFASLPSSVRARFGHDSDAFGEFIAKHGIESVKEDFGADQSADVNGEQKTEAISVSNGNDSNDGDAS